MTIICPKCKTRLKISDEKERQEGARIRCAKCSAVLVYKGKGGKGEPEREEEPGAALRPFPETQIRQSQRVAETERTVKEDAVDEALSSQAAPEISSVREQAPAGISQKEHTLQTLKKTMAAREAERVSLPAGNEKKRGIPGKAVMAGSAVAILLLLLMAVFIFRSPETVIKKRPLPAPPAGETTSQPPAGSSPQGNTPIASPAVPAAEVPVVQASSATPEEKAVEMVKRSDVLMKMTTVESIVNKWTQDNAGKYKVVGWQVKKIDDRQYLVSYTALEDNTPKGFYFVADIQGNTVEDLAHNPELQKKYNIQYAR